MPLVQSLPRLTVPLAHCCLDKLSRNLVYVHTKYRSISNAKHAFYRFLFRPPRCLSPDDGAFGSACDFPVVALLPSSSPTDIRAENLCIFSILWLHSMDVYNLP